MSNFENIFSSSPEKILRLFESSNIDLSSVTIEKAAKSLRLRRAQLICALGFHPQVDSMLDIVFILGYDSLDSLLKERNKTFVSDVYQKLTVKQVLTIYDAFLTNPDYTAKFITKILARRARQLEMKIENTVRPKLIENYRLEMRYLYTIPQLPIEFVELRLENTSSGYRALIDEIGLIVNARLIPPAELFLRNNVLPEEKRRLISRGLIKRQLIETRLKFKEISDQERQILQHYLFHESN